MKKHFFSSLFFLFFFSLYAQSVQVTVIDMSPVELAGLSAASKSKLESNLRRYAGFEMISSDTEAIKNIQRESESVAFDESTAIQVGKLTAAKYGAFFSIKKAGSVYTMSVQFTNLETGVMTPFSATRKTESELFDGVYCAVDEITLNLCNDKFFTETLGVYLSPTDKELLRYGENDLSDRARLEANLKEQETFKKQIESLDKEISLLSVSSDLSASAQKAKAEAERQTALAKLNAAIERQQRIEEEEQKKAEAERLAAEDERNNNEKINAAAKEANSKVKELRSLKFEGTSLLGKIKVVEAKKKAILEIRDDVNLKIDEINQTAQKDIQAKIQEIDGKEYRRGELDSNRNPLPEVLAKRESTKNEETEKILKKANEDSEKIKSSVKSQENEIKVEILRDYESLGKNAYINSLDENLFVSYGDYDGVKKSWPVTFAWFSDDIPVYSLKIFLPIEFVTGKKYGGITDEYLDDVDIYDRLFMLGEKVFVYEFEYSVVHLDDEPSVYQTNVSSLNIYETSTLNVKNGRLVSNKSKSTSLENQYFRIESKPVYDIRTEEEINEANEIKQKELQKQIQKENKILEQEEKEKAELLRQKQREELKAIQKQENRQKYNWAYGDEIFMSVSIGATIPTDENLVGKGSFDLSAAAGTDEFYLKAGLGFSSDDEFDKLVNKMLRSDGVYYYHLDEDSSAMTAYLGIGTSFRIHLFQVFHPRFFAEISLGAKSRGYEIYYSSTSPDDYAVCLTMPMSAGIEIPLSKSFSLSGAYTYQVTLVDESFYTEKGISFYVSFALR